MNLQENMGSLWPSAPESKVMKRQHSLSKKILKENMPMGLGLSYPKKVEMTLYKMIPIFNS